jgi:DNA-binding GntR family transcriptional regulator
MSKKPLRFIVPPPASPLVPGLANQIVDMIRREGLPVGHRLTEAVLCDELQVSRSPVRKALQFLEALGTVTSEVNRGFQVARSAADLGSFFLPAPAQSDEALYMRIVDDRIAGNLADSVGEAELMERYDASRLQIQRSLNRMAREGLIERKTGRGWAFLPLLTTADAYRESYRFRMIIEPSAILEPGYAVDAAELEKCYREQMDLVAGGIETWSQSELFRTGVHFHETLVAGARNSLLLDALRKVNQMRRLVEYRSKRDRKQTSIYMHEQCSQHLVLIDLLRRNERVEAAHYLRAHLDGARNNKIKNESGLAVGQSAAKSSR